MAEYAAEITVNVPEEPTGPLWEAISNNKYVKAKDGLWVMVEDTDNVDFGLLTWENLLTNYGPFTDQAPIAVGDKLTKDNISVLSIGAIFAAPGELPWFKKSEQRLTQGDTSISPKTFVEDYLEIEDAKIYVIYNP